MMGMFDWVIPDMDLLPIPNSLKNDIGNNQWQSKSFDKTLDTYHLSHTIKKVVKDDECNVLNEIEDFNFTGECLFYVGVGDTNDPKFRFIDIKFVYKNGELIHMEWVR